MSGPDKLPQVWAAVYGVLGVPAGEHKAIRRSDPTFRGPATFPVFEGSTVRCSPKGVAIDWLATPLYERIWLAPRSTAKLRPYSHVVFVDVGRGPHELIRSRAQCDRALATYKPGPWRT